MSLIGGRDKLLDDVRYAMAHIAWTSAFTIRSPGTRKLLNTMLHDDSSMGTTPQYKQQGVVLVFSERCGDGVAMIGYLALTKLSASDSRSFHSESRSLKSAFG
jgi:hypothetical protein